MKFLLRFPMRSRLVDNIKPQKIFPSSVGHGAFVYGCATGQHSFLMSCFFTNQVFAQLGFDEVLEGIYGRRERGLFLAE